MDCRRRAADAGRRACVEAALERARRHAAQAWQAPAVATAPVVWLRHHADEFAPPHPDGIAALRDHLLSLEHDATPPAATQEDPWPGNAPDGPIDAAMCTWCRGRCCRIGLPEKAFITSRQLRAWLAEHPAADWSDAVDDYLGFLPAEHLDESCLFHTRTGCALPRERRSVICNRYACDTLAQARTATASPPGSVVVAGIAGTHGLEGAAIVSIQGHRQLPPPPSP
jgi:hypothetical protein